MADTFPKTFTQGLGVFKLCKFFPLIRVYAFSPTPSPESQRYGAKGRASFFRIKVPWCWRKHKKCWTFWVCTLFIGFVQPCRAAIFQFSSLLTWMAKWITLTHGPLVLKTYNQLDSSKFQSKPFWGGFHKWKRIPALLFIYGFLKISCQIFSLIYKTLGRWSAT